MCIHQYTLLLRVHIIIPVLLIENSVIMHIHEYALVRICINALLRIRINASQTVQGHHPDRICILVYHVQPMCIIFMNTHDNGFLWALWKLTMNTEPGRWKLSLRKILPYLFLNLKLGDFRRFMVYFHGEWGFVFFVDLGGYWNNDHEEQ